MFHSPQPVRLDELHPLISMSTSRILSHDLPDGYQQFMPQHGEDIWSQVDEELHHQDVPTSLTDLRRKASKTIIAHTQGGHGKLTAKDIERLFGRNKVEWHDAEAFVWKYHDKVDDPLCPVKYDRKVFISNIDKPFPLPVWWAYHRPGCTACMEHLRAHSGNELEALYDNRHNSCWFADILCWLSGGWRLPLKKLPSPAQKDNYPSLLWSVSSMKTEVQRMVDNGVIVEGQPSLINPGMSVVRLSDVEDRCRILEEIGHPSPSREPKDIDIINNHINHILALHTKVPFAIGAIGSLKPIKIRYCLDLSVLLNDETKPLEFSYASVRHAVALLKKRSYMAKIDLER